MGRAEIRIEDAEKVVGLGHGADGRARVAGVAFLLDGNRGRKAGDLFDFGLGHLLDELAGIRRERLDVAALAFGVDRLKRKGGFS